MQNDQWDIPHLFPHTKTILKQSFPNILYIFIVFIIFIVWGRRRYYLYTVRGGTVRAMSRMMSRVVEAMH